MLVIRSLIFNILFYAALIVLLIVGLPALFINRFAVFYLALLWAKATFWLMRVICGTHVEFRGIENIPKGPCIVAPKHQSIWEVFALPPFFTDFTFILKRELTWIPFFGWYLGRADLTAINRSKGAAALAQAKARAHEALAAGRQLVIFPEGTRRPAAAPPQYKFGVAHIYADNSVPCVPVALNSGLFWARRSFLRRPGTIIVEFLPPIPPGYDKNTFYQLLCARLETASDRIIGEALQQNPELKAVVPADWESRRAG